MDEIIENLFEKNFIIKIDKFVQKQLIKWYNGFNRQYILEIYIFCCSGGEVFMKENKNETSQNYTEKLQKMKNKILGGKNKIFLLILIIIIIILVIIFLRQNKKEDIKISVKSSLDRIVEKSDLETVNITYNVIAKKCEDDINCNLKSNNIDDFKYVVSCKGTITAGIDFSKIKIEIDEKNKRLIVKMPEATIKGEPSIGPIEFLDAKDIPADEYPNARELCQATIKSKSSDDGKLLPAAKEQARAVLEEFYKQWIRAYDSKYTVEVE